MIKLKSSWVSLFILAVLTATAAAQAASDASQAPPKILVVSREILKPGKGGSPHERTESMFVQAMTAAKWPTHYLGTDSMSGVGRSVFFTGYDSFAAWGKDIRDTFSNPTLSAALDRAFIADGELLSGYESSTLMYRADLSYKSNVDIAAMRYFEVIRFKTRPGHEMEFEALAKMYVDSYGKSVPNAHWATYQSIYGPQNGGVYVVFTPMKSLDEVDSSMAAQDKFMQALGESGMKKMMELSAASIESTETNVLVFNPKISYPPDAWVKSDPSFWKSKAAAAKPAAAKPEAKPAQ